MAVHIEPASLSHLDGYNKAVTSVSQERRFLATVQGFPLESSRWYLTRQIESGWPMFVALDGSEVVGWCDVAGKEIPEFSHVGVLGMGVLASYRGQGVGKVLLRAALDQARNHHTFEKVELHVFGSNSVAQNLYRTMGFEVEGRRRMARKLDGRYDDEIDMALFLDVMTGKPS